MALSLTMAAFRDASREQILQALRGRVEASGYKIDEAPGSTWDVEASLCLNAPKDRWCALEWPGLFLLSDNMTRDISAALGTMAAFVQINREESWTSLVFVAGDLQDEFNSYPDADSEAQEFITDQKFPVEEMRAKWRGRPETLGRLFGVDAGILASYMVCQGGEAFDPAVKACPGDTHALGDPWIIVDFWKRLGIPWPSDDPQGKTLFRLSKRA